MLQNGERARDNRIAEMKVITQDDIASLLFHSECNFSPPGGEQVRTVMQDKDRIKLLVKSES